MLIQVLEKTPDIARTALARIIGNRSLGRILRTQRPSLPFGRRQRPIDGGCAER